MSRDPVSVRLRGDEQGAPALWERLEGRANALNALRLALAIAVAVSHALILGGAGLDVLTEQMGGLAVGGFFCISGFLIAGSRERMPFLPFMWRRVLRLMPAYWTVLGVTALLFAPLAWLLSGGSQDWRAATSYLVRDSLLMQFQTGIGDTLASAPAPYTGVWNSSLWTLPYEFGAYLVAGLALSWLTMRTAAAAVVTCIVLSVIVVAQWFFGLWLSVLDPNVGRLASFFAAGVLMHALRQRLPASPLIAFSCAAAIAAAAPHGYALATLVTPLPMAYLILWLGARLPLRVGVINDISYGMYIYAFPIQQLLVVIGAAALMPSTLFAVVSVLCVLPFAWASWLLVERPSLRLRRLVPVGVPAAPVIGVDPVAPATQ